MWSLLRRSFTSNSPSKELLESLTYYELLKVKPNSSKADIRKSYLALARKHHPDLQNEPSLEFSYINRAYQILMDDYEKAKYDDSLINDKDYFKIGYGRFSISLKYFFLTSLGVFLFVMASGDEQDYEKICPNDHKMKKISIQDLVEKEEADDRSKDKESDDIQWKKNVRVRQDKIVTGERKKFIFSDRVFN